MGRLDDVPGAEPDSGTEGAAELPLTSATRRRRSLGIWLLTLANLLCAGCLLLGIRFLASAARYAVTGSAEFGSDLEAILTGILVLKVCGYVLIVGFLIASAGLLSLTRLGWRIQALWAILLCLTIAGLLYGVPALMFLLRGRTRSRFFPDSPLSA